MPSDSLNSVSSDYFIRLSHSHAVRLCHRCHATSSASPLCCLTSQADRRENELEDLTARLNIVPRASLRAAEAGAAALQRERAQWAAAAAREAREALEAAWGQVIGRKTEEDPYVKVRKVEEDP